MYVYYQVQQYHGRSGDHKPDFQVEAHAAGRPGSYLLLRCNKRHSVGREDPEGPPQMLCPRHQTRAVQCSKFFTIYHFI